MGHQRRCLSWHGIYSHVGHFFAPRVMGVACWLPDMDKTLVEMDVCYNPIENHTWVVFSRREPILVR